MHIVPETPRRNYNYVAASGLLCCRLKLLDILSRKDELQRMLHFESPWMELAESSHQVAKLGDIREDLPGRQHPSRCKRIKTNFRRGRIAPEVMEKSLEPRKLHTADGNGLFNHPAARSSSSFFFFVATLFLFLSSPFLSLLLSFFLSLNSWIKRCSFVFYRLPTDMYRSLFTSHPCVSAA